MEKNYKILDFKPKNRKEATKEEYLAALESAYGLDKPEEVLKRTLKAIGNESLRNIIKAFYIGNLHSFSLSIGNGKEENLIKDMIDRYCADGVYKSKAPDFSIGERVLNKVEEYIDNIKNPGDLRIFAMKSQGFIDTINKKVCDPTKNYFLLKQLLALHPDKNFNTTFETTMSDMVLTAEAGEDLKALPDTFSGIAKAFCDILTQKNITSNNALKERLKYRNEKEKKSEDYKKEIEKIVSNKSLSDSEKDKLRQDIVNKREEELDKVYNEYQKKINKIERDFSEYKEKTGLTDQSLRTADFIQRNLQKTKLQSIKGMLKSLNPNGLKTSCKSISHEEFNPYNYERDDRFVVDFEGRVKDPGLNKELKKIIESILGDVEIRSTERTFSRPSRCAHFIKNAFLPVYKKNKPRKQPLFFIDSSGSMYLGESKKEKAGIPFKSKTAMIAAFLRDNNRKISELHPRYFHFNACPAEEFDIKGLLPTARGGNNMLFLKTMDDKCTNIVFTDGGFDDQDYNLLKRWVEKHPNMNVHWVCNDTYMIDELKRACGKYKSHQVHYCAF